MKSEEDFYELPDTLKSQMMAYEVIRESEEAEQRMFMAELMAGSRMSRAV